MHHHVCEAHAAQSGLHLLNVGVCGSCAGCMQSQPWSSLATAQVACNLSFVRLVHM